MGSEWDLHSEGELVLGMGDFNGNVGKRIGGYDVVHGGNGIGEGNVEGKMKRSCVWQTLGSESGRRGN